MTRHKDFETTTIINDVRETIWKAAVAKFIANELSIKESQSAKQSEEMRQENQRIVMRAIEKGAVPYHIPEEPDKVYEAMMSYMPRHNKVSHQQQVSCVISRQIQKA